MIRHTKPIRILSSIVVVALLVSSLPCDDLIAAVVEQRSKNSALPVPQPLKVNRTVPKITPISPFPTFTADTKDEEITHARVFEEPLLPTASGTPAENRALSSSLLSYLKGGNTEDLSALETFLREYPQSVWRLSLLTNMGIVYRHTGYFTRALAAWQEAWKLGSNETAPGPRAIADRAVAEWAELNARLGRYDILETLFHELEHRDVGGAPAEKLRGAKQGLWLMENRPTEAFRCGPMALDRILAFNNAKYDREQIKKSESTLRGMSLTQVVGLSDDFHMNFQMAQREIGAEVLLPAVVHWRAGHYAALLREQDGRYLVQDPTFGDEFWVSRPALDEQSSGYFLVAGGKLPAGWRPVGNEEGNQVWGKGNTGTDDPRAITPDDEKSHGPMCPAKGMADYNIHLMLVSLNIIDTPVGYAPPRGPAIDFQVTYNYRESFQPSVFSYSNLGPKWTFDWLSYIKDDPSNLSASAYLYVRGGGEQVFSGFNSSTQSYAAEFRTRAILTRTSTTPIRYERRLPDGSIEVFAQADGAATFPRRIFMTEWRDAIGNGLTFTYDASLRLVAVTDAIGQVTTISYQLGSDPLKITKVTDPFGRFATFDYTSTGRLNRITDVIGIQSHFSYLSSDFIATLTTPYGTTTFNYGESGRTRWLEAGDPIGGTERVEFRPDAPGIPIAGEPVPTGLQATSSYLQYRNSFYWDKRALSQYPGNYTKAILYHWLHMTDLNVTSGVMESMKRPLENRIWYDYPGQNSAYDLGLTAQPIFVARVLDDGSTQLYKYEYNVVGKVTKITDPLGRETVFVYGANNVADPDPPNGTGIDLLEIRQKNGAVYDVLESRTYNAQHLPLTVTDAARQTTTLTYLSTGDLQTVITPPRGGLTVAQRTTTYQYNADNASLGPGRLQRITGPVSGATTDLAYDGYGRIRTLTESDGYATTTDYDNLDRTTQITFPDGTYEQRMYNRLDLSDTRDRLGRWTHYVYDALRRLVFTRDPLGQTITQQWCNCGSLSKLTDANGNATTWDRDDQNRVIKETRANASYSQSTYENTTSRLKRRTDAKGQQTNYTYFKDDTLANVNYSNATPATPSVSFTYDPAYNRVATTVDGTGTTSYGYLPVTTGGTLGAALLSSVDGPLTNDTITYTYDELGRGASRSINGTANATTNTYDPLGRIDSIVNPLGTFGYSYVNQTSRLSSVSYPNAQTTSFTYLANSADRRLSEIHNQLSGGVTLSKFNYTYNVMGNIGTWTQQKDNGASAVTRAYDFGYDATDQLTSATYRTTDTNPTILNRYVYAYDAAANRTTEQIDDTPLKATYNNVNRLLTQEPGGWVRFEGTVSEAATVTVQGKAATVSSANAFGASVTLGSGTSNVQIVATDYSGNQRTNTYSFSTSGTTKTFTHDANGNLTGDGTRTFEWDAENRLVAVVNGTHRSEFTYDGLSRRVRIVEKDNGTTTTDYKYVWCSVEVCEERDSTGAATTKRFFSQGEQQSTDSLYYTRDQLGSIRELTDSTSAIRARYDYDPYGRTTKASGDKDASFSFTGHYAHVVSGLLLTPYRAYDPNLGRWLSEDPTGFSAGINLIAYVHNSPTISVDPLGLSDLVLDKARKTLTLYDYNGEPVARYPAGNITIRPNGDPNTVGSNGPAPSGYFPLQKPVNTAGRPEYGAYFFPVGAVDKKGRPADIARKRGIGVHAGRRGPESPTEGCIRVGDQTIRELVDWNKIDPIRTITIE